MSFQRITSVSSTFEHALEDGWTLPAGWYSDPVVLELERQRIFASSWHYAGRTGELPEVGSFFTTEAGHVPAVVVRDRDGDIRAFVNVCRHRGHIVASGVGCKQTLQCPYHAWTYELDGSLRRAPRAEREEGFDPAELSLLPMSVDTWGQLVFVNPDPEAAPLADALGDIPELIAQGGLDFDSLRFHSRDAWEIRSNWKIALENYLECYHCSVAHPGFSKVIDVDPDSYKLLLGPTYASQLGPVRESALSGKGSVPYVPRGDVTQSQYHYVWPATTINIAPGPQNFSIERWVALGPRLTLEATDYFFAPDVSDEQIAELLAFDTEVGTEDTALVEAVQAGLDSGAVQQGRLMPESEQLIADFQRRIRDAVGEPVVPPAVSRA